MRRRLKTALSVLGGRAAPVGLTALIYHRVGGGSPDERDVPTAAFAEQVRLLRDAPVVPLDEAVDRLEGGDARASVVLTFEQRTRFPSNPAPLRASSPPSVRFAVAPVSARSVPATTSGLLASSQARLVISRDDHLSKILTARAHIDSGAASEICLTQRIDAPFAGDPFALWQELRRASASPFAAFFDLPEGAVVSSSPERLLSVDQGHDGLAAIRASFPPESMTGTPKLEAMTLLERLEPTERGVYSGALGWMDFAGPLELSVVTRTIIVKDGHAHLHVGGAIVTDSNEATEHDVTMNDARELLAALAMLAPQDASTSGAAP